MIKQLILSLNIIHNELYEIALLCSNEEKDNIAVELHKAGIMVSNARNMIENKIGMENTKQIDIEVINMKTDLEILKEMFTRSGITFEIENNEMVVDSGYCGFCSCFTFTPEGKLLTVGAYE